MPVCGVHVCVYACVSSCAFLCMVCVCMHVTFRHAMIDSIGTVKSCVSIGPVSCCKCLTQYSLCGLPLRLSVLSEGTSMITVSSCGVKPH